MTGRVLAISLVAAILLMTIGCSQNAQLSSITVTPATVTIPSAGGTAQFTANGLYKNGKNGTQYSQPINSEVNWSSSVPSVATVNSSGLATAVAEGTTSITATGGNGSISGSATLTVTAGQNGGNTLLSIQVIPDSQAVNQPNETAQYIAIGTYSGTPATQDVTNQVTWSSSDVRIATINSAGLATAVGDCGAGQTTITALAPPSSGTAVTGTATFIDGTCGTNNLPTLTVYPVGQGAGTVTSSPAGISCGSGAGCTGNFTLGSVVTLTAAPGQGTVFGGFSANCTPVIPDPSGCTALQSNVSSCTCSLTMIDNATVGAIFNVPN